MAAACLLAEAGLDVTLVEQRKFLGGRAYSFTERHTGTEIDNGQHLFFGCFEYSLDFFGKIGALSDLTIFQRTVVPFKQRGKRLSSFSYHRLPFPFHLIFAVLSLRHIGFSERIGLLRVGSFLFFANKNTLRGLEKVTVRQWLAGLGQTDNAIKYFWEILAVAIMNESIERSSAFLFASALKQVFTRGHMFSRMIVPRAPLSKLYVDRSVEFLNKLDCQIEYGCRVERLEKQNNRVVGVETRDGRKMSADFFVLAVPFFEIGQLLPKIQPALTSSPIVSIHLWLDPEFVSDHIPEPFFALVGARVQWLFNKHLDSGSGLVTLVISDAREFVSMSNDEIVDLSVEDLKGVLTGFRRGHVRHHQVVREHRATFSACCGSESQRHGAKTDLENLFLCGDWTDTGLPATVESAAKSAYLAVGEIRKSLKRERESA